VSNAHARRLRADSVQFETEAGRRLDYTHLKAWDATGRILPSRMAVPDANTLQLLIDDAGATYPIAVDPILSASADAQFEADQADSYLGASVAGAGDINGDGFDDVIVGAYGYDSGEADEGIALIYLGSASGIASGNPGTADTFIEGVSPARPKPN
jgi:hypothetical protein